MKTGTSASMVRFDLKSPGVWVVPLVAAVGFLVLVATGANQPLFFTLNAIGPQTSDLMWAHFTVMGDSAVALALCLGLWRRRPDLLWALAIAVVLGTAWVHILKPLAAIPRPLAVLGDAVHVIGQPYRAHNSFPSGHATTCFVVAGVIALGLASRVGAALVVAIAAVGALSRVVVGVHWPADILAGAFGGWLAAAIALALARRSLAFGLRPSVQWTVGILLAGCAVALIIGYKTGYPQAAVFQRVVGVVCLLPAIAALWRDRAHAPKSISSTPPG
jgi:membrane-associated phospholipid phosphatase